MFNPNFIEIYDNALTSYQCKEVIRWVETQSFTRGKCSGDNNEAVVKLKVKDSWDVHRQFSKKNFVDLLISDALIKYTPFYIETYPSVNLMQSWVVDDEYNIQKYDPGGGYPVSHCENTGGRFVTRVLAWMIYLNTVTDKGGTYFSFYNKTIRAKEGRLVIWPAYFTHFHKGVVSKTQTKYIATGWYSFL
tara:strand:+ start:350 stop:919 length:570 start_codon:yes stop_codon:yes gene_type:complete